MGGDRGEEKRKLASLAALAFDCATKTMWCKTPGTYDSERNHGDRETRY